MNFASKAFFIFLPVALLVYHTLPTRAAKYRFLLLASWLFYAWAVPAFLWVIVLTSVIDYAAGRLIESAATPARKKLWLAASLVANLGLLGVFKYTSFLWDNSVALAGLVGYELPRRWFDIVLPLGISFHTFQGISYTLDVYRGKLTAVRSFTDFALFVAFFPQLVAGPIVRAVEFLPQMVQPPPVTAAQVVEGLHLFVLGLFKKVFVADRLAQFVDPVFAEPHLFDADTHRWAVLAYACQIYCDFSGYSDLATGCAKWFGFELPVNFNFPYIATSISDFWRRWHVTLSTWIRDYLYISLGGSRGGDVRTYANLTLAMTLCGLWHGPSWNYVLWGAYNGVLLSLHRAWDKAVTGVGWLDAVRAAAAYRVSAWASTMMLFAAGLVLVRAQGWQGCLLFESSLFGVGLADGVRHWVPVWVPLLAACVAVEHVFGGLRGGRFGLGVMPSPVRAAAYVGVVALVVVLNPGVGKPFIYFQF